jgi:hypothetical protein
MHKCRRPKKLRVSISCHVEKMEVNDLPTYVPTYVVCQLIITHLCMYVGHGFQIGITTFYINASIYTIQTKSENLVVCM